MNYGPDEINREIAFVVQACLGEISQNFLSIILTPQVDEILLQFTLEAENERDRASIEDIVADYYAMHDDDPIIRVEVNAASTPSSPLPAFPARAIYIKKGRAGV